MPGTIEALLIVLVFVVPGFVTVSTREFFVPSVGKHDPIQITLRSITASLLYVPVWLLVAPGLLVLRSQLAKAFDKPETVATQTLYLPIGAFLIVGLVLPICVGLVWAVAYRNDWYAKAAERVYPKLGLRPPGRGVGDDLWDKLWLNREREYWLTVYLKDSRIYVGRGVEFSQSGLGRDLLLGNDSRLYDKDWSLIRNMADAGGDRVWIPADQVVSIEIYDPPPGHS